MYHLPEYKETNNVDDYMASITSIPAMNEEAVAPKTFTCGCFPRQMADTLSGLFIISCYIVIVLHIKKSVCTCRDTC